MTVGHRIRLCRQVRDITQSGLALQAGLHRNHIALIEANAPSPTIRTLQRIADVLGVTCGQLLGEQPLTTLLEEATHG